MYGECIYSNNMHLASISPLCTTHSESSVITITIVIPGKDLQNDLFPGQPGDCPVSHAAIMSSHEVRIRSYLFNCRERTTILRSRIIKVTKSQKLKAKNCLGTSFVMFLRGRFRSRRPRIKCLRCGIKSIILPKLALHLIGLQNVIKSSILLLSFLFTSNVHSQHIHT